MQAVEGRMDELLRRQSSLERVLTAELAELHKTLRSSTGAEQASVRMSWGYYLVAQRSAFRLSCQFVYSRLILLAREPV